MKEKIKTISFFAIIIFCCICASILRLAWENQRIDKRIQLQQEKTQ